MEIRTHNRPQRSVSSFIYLSRYISFPNAFSPESFENCGNISCCITTLSFSRPGKRLLHPMSTTKIGTIPSPFCFTIISPKQLYELYADKYQDRCNRPADVKRRNSVRRTQQRHRMFGTLAVVERGSAPLIFQVKGPQGESSSFPPLSPDSRLTGGFEAAEMVAAELLAQASTNVSHSGYVAKAASPYSAPPSFFFWLFSKHPCSCWLWVQRDQERGVRVNYAHTQHTEVIAWGGRVRELGRRRHFRTSAAGCGCRRLLRGPNRRGGGGGGRRG